MRGAGVLGVSELRVAVHEIDDRSRKPGVVVHGC
jgi:hypothetical protein